LSGGNSAKEAELARMKGEYDALQQTAIQRNCIKSPPPTTASVTSETQTIPPSRPTTGVQPAIAATTPAATPSQPVPPPQRTATLQPAVSSAGTQPTLVQTSSIAGGPSKYMINAERHAKASGCSAPVATMNISTPNYEVFTLRCGNGAEPLLVRCDYGVCKSLQ